MKKIKLIIISSYLLSPMIATPCVINTFNNKIEVGQINNSTISKNIYKIDKNKKWGNTVFQNVWSMNDSEAKREKENIPTNIFQGNKELQYLTYLSENKNGEIVKNPIKTIGSGAFQGCKKLESAWLPGDGSDTTAKYSIEKRAFFRCENLKTLDFTAFDVNSDALANIEIGESAFEGLPENGKIILKNTNCKLWTTKDGTATGEFVDFYSTKVKNNLKTFANKLVNIGKLPESWLESINIVVVDPPYRSANTEAGESSTRKYWDWEKIKKDSVLIESGAKTLDQIVTKWGEPAIGMENYSWFNNKQHAVRIIGAEHQDDIISDGEYINKTAAFTFCFETVWTDESTSYIRKQWNSTSSSPKYNIWNNGTQSCDIRNYLIETVKPEIEKTIGEDQIKTVYKKTTQGNKITTINNLPESVWLLSHSEITYTKTTQKIDEGKYYEYFTGENDQLLKITTSGGTVGWWLRSPYGTSSDTSWHVSEYGGTGTASVNPTISGWRSYGVIPCFCI